jgi:hypothetical protein
MEQEPWIDFQRMMFKNKLHAIISNFCFYFPEEFEKTNIKMCTECGGSGLPCKPKQEITYWQPGTICEKCGGFGYKFNEVNGQYICKKCNGTGCNKCNHTGFVDWVTNAMGVK